MRLHWFVSALVLAVMLTYLQSEAVINFLYWRYSWFDILMHLLGGATIGTFLIALLARSRPRAYVGLLLVAFIGWEVFEYVSGIPREANYALDTAIDLVMDFIGAFAAYAAARITLWRSA